MPDPEAPPEPEPGPDPEPPEPEPPSPPTEGLEPPVAGATHVGLKVGPARQTVTAIGFGLGSPGGQSPAKTLEKHTKVLVKRSRRQLDPAQRPEHGLRRQLQGAGRRRDQAGPRHQLREQPDHQPGRQRQERSSAGSCSCWPRGSRSPASASRNEPSYRLWGGDKARAIHKAYRDELDRQGLQKIILVSPEFANTDSW